MHYFPIREWVVRVIFTNYFHVTQFNGFWVTTKFMDDMMELLSETTWNCNPNDSVLVMLAKLQPSPSGKMAGIGSFWPFLTNWSPSALHTYFIHWLSKSSKIIRFWSCRSNFGSLEIDIVRRFDVSSVGFWWLRGVATFRPQICWFSTYFMYGFNRFSCFDLKWVIHMKYHTVETGR